MILLDPYNTPHHISSLTDVKNMNGYMYYDLIETDFFPGRTTAVVELQSSSLTIEVEKNLIHLPVNWFVVVCDKATSQLDTIPVHELTNTNFKMLGTGPKVHVVTEIGYRVVNFDHDRTFYYPIFTKFQLLCVAVTPSKWILISPNDTYQKYLKHLCIADLML